MLFFVSFCIFLEANIPFSKSRISFKANLWWVVGCSGVCLLAISVPQRFTGLVESLCFRECFSTHRSIWFRFRFKVWFKENNKFALDHGTFSFLDFLSLSQAHTLARFNLYFHCWLLKKLNKKSKLCKELFFKFFLLQKKGWKFGAHPHHRRFLEMEV